MKLLPISILITSTKISTTTQHTTSITHFYNKNTSEIETITGVGSPSPTKTFYKLKKWRQKYAKTVSTLNGELLSSEWDQMLTPNGRYIIPVYFDVDSQIKDIGATYESHDKYTSNFKKVFNENFKIAAEKFREKTCIDLLPLKLNKKSKLTFDWKVLDKNAGSLKSEKKNSKNSKNPENPPNLQTDFEKLLNTNKKMLRKLKQALRKKSFRYVDVRSDSHDSISSGTKICGNNLLGRTKKHRSAIITTSFKQSSKLCRTQNDYVSIHASSRFRLRTLQIR